MIYERMACDLNESLFSSVYMDLQSLASSEQARIYRGCKSRRKGLAPADYYVGEAQTALSAFCRNLLSLGEAMDLIARYRRPPLGKA